MFLLKLFVSFLLANAINHTNITYFKNKIGKPNTYQKQLITIPSINLNTPYVIGNQAMDKLDYIQLAPYTNLPSDKDAYLIFMAHSGNSEISYFKNISQLKIDDIILITFNHKKYRYLVYKKIIITPTNFKALYYQKNTLILLTCYQHKYRLLVYAKLKPVN